MLKTAVTGIVLGVAVTSTGFAGNVLNSIIFANKHPQAKSQNINSKTNATDFSGNWIGTCSDIDGPVPLQIEQGVNYISIDGHSFIFGAMTTLASSDVDSYDNVQMRFTWNPTKTILNLNATNTQTYNSEKNLQTIVSETSFAINNDQLIMEIKAVMHDNTETISDNYKNTCSFKKTS